MTLQKTQKLSIDLGRIKLEIFSNDISYHKPWLPHYISRNLPNGDTKKNTAILEILNKSFQKNLDKRLNQDIGLRIKYKKSGNNHLILLHKPLLVLIEPYILILVNGSSGCESKGSDPNQPLKITVEYNNSYKLLRNVREISRAILQRMLLSHRYSLIRGAALKYNNTTILIGAHSDTGKTTTVKEFLKREKNVQVFGDDAIITDGKIIYPYPQEITDRKYLFTRIPFLRREVITKKYDYEIAEPAKPDVVFILERGKKNETIELTREEATTKLLLTTEAAFPLYPHPTPLLAIFDYLLLDNDYHGFPYCRTKIVESLLEKTKEFYLVRTPRPELFYQTIKKVLSD